MAFEPFTIFSRRRDTLGVANLLKRIAYEVEITGPESCWEKIVVSAWKGGWFNKAPRLTFTHDPDYYESDGWHRQVDWMRNYFANFPDSKIKPEVLATISTFSFALGVPQHDLDINSDDERLQLVYAVCKYLDGVIFTPSSLRDASGRILLGSNGECDENSVLPERANSDDSAHDESAEEDEQREASPPSPRRVARRALALAAVTARGLFEVESSQIENPEGYRQDLLAAVADIGIGDELEPEEWQLIQSPIGTLDHQDTIDAVWRAEGLAVLAWALGVHPLLADDQMADVPELWEAVGIREEDKARAFLDDPRLRPADELSEMQIHLGMFHWRMRQYQVSPDAMDFVAFSRKCWIGSFDISKFRICESDLAIGDRPLHEASEEDISRVQSISDERHRAINWLMGCSEIYSDTDTST